VASADGFDSATASGRPIAYTLGYSHRFPLGLTLGVHYMNSLATDYEYDDLNREIDVFDDDGNVQQSTLRAEGITEVEDLTVRTIGVTIGFRF